MPTYLYAISDDAGNIKFGLAKDPTIRLGALKIGNAQRLTILETCQIKDGDNPADHEWNAHFCLGQLGLGVRGEWFRPSIFTTIAVAAMSCGDAGQIMRVVSMLYHELSISLDDIRKAICESESSKEWTKKHRRNGIKANDEIGLSSTPAKFPEWAYKNYRSEILWCST